MLCVFFFGDDPKKACNEHKWQRPAFQKQGLCFPLTKQFLWAQECKNWARTYNKIVLSVFFGGVSKAMERVRTLMCSFLQMDGMLFFN